MNIFFNLFTNSPEYSNPLPDRFDRARFYNTENKNIFEPVISNEIYSSGFRPYYPDGKNFSVCVSHDIDHLFLLQSSARKILNISKDLVRGRFSSSLFNSKLLIKNQVNRDYNLQKLININNSYSVRASYYFLSLNKGEEDYNYFPGDICDQLQLVLNNNDEIGLHGGHKAFNNPEKMKQEKELLEKYVGAPVVGYRNHYLKFELPTTWAGLQENGFLYDTTLGYADCIGFRNGMCYPYYPFDMNKNQYLDIVELPLIIMDATLFFYMRLDANIAFKICRQIVERVKKCKGVLTLLWHNNFLTGEMGAFYLQLLDFLRSEDPWFTSSRDLISWWKQEKLLQQSQEILETVIKR